MRMLFGTDGIRGVAGDPPLDAATVFAVGAALGRQLKAQHGEAQVVIGQDTRESSAWIAESLTRGLESAGVASQSAGVITTPAVAFLARGGFAAGVVISVRRRGQPVRQCSLRIPVRWPASSGARQPRSRPGVYKWRVSSPRAME